MTVLLVDDEPEILNILSDTLKTVGFDVHTCDNGQAALDYLDKAQPELMVTDLRMPGISGTELLKRVRERRHELPVVFLTGFGDMKSAVEAMRLGAFDYLSKPIDADRLIQTLNNAVKHAQLVKENRTLVEHLTKANQLKAQFLHGMSHEIRTPLGHITGFAEILESTLENLTDKQKRYLQNIQNAAKRLLYMFDDMLQYVDLSSGDVPIAKDAFHLAKIFDKVQQSLVDLIHTHNLTLNVHLLNPELSIISDEVIVEKIVEILLKNAVQFSPENGTVTLTTTLKDKPESAEISEGVAPPGSVYLHVAITDEGPGIDPEDHDRIFNLFEQLDGTLSREHEGTGMGLALAKDLAHRLGGCINLKSALDQGSTFTLIIPISLSK